MMPGAIIGCEANAKVPRPVQTERDAGPVGVAINRLDSEIGMLHEQISSLVSILSPILGDEGENACGRPSYMPECRMEEVIVAAANGVENAADRIRALRARIKL